MLPLSNMALYSAVSLELMQMQTVCNHVGLRIMLVLGNGREPK